MMMKLMKCNFASCKFVATNRSNSKKVLSVIGNNVVSFYLVLRNLKKVVLLRNLTNLDTDAATRPRGHAQSTNEERRAKG